MSQPEQQTTETGGGWCRCGDPESAHTERPMDWNSGVDVQDACSQCPCWTFKAWDEGSDGESDGVE